MEDWYLRCKIAVKIIKKCLNECCIKYNKYNKKILTLNLIEKKEIKLKISYSKILQKKNRRQQNKT